MARKQYVHYFRRRREGKTDYRKRRGMVVGKVPFLSVKVTGRYIYVQLLRAAPRGDETLCSASSRDLGKFGWRGSSKNLPSAFLTGYYLGQIAKANNLRNAILYSGVGRYVHGSRISSVISGAKQGGLQVAVNDESLPDEERIKGNHIVEFAKELASNDKERYDRTFSKILKSGSTPLNYPADFDKVKMAIQKGVTN